MPVFIIETKQGIYKWKFLDKEEEFSLNFVHSVELTPVTETFLITKEKTFKLESIEYQSLNAGLPFLPDDGVFYQQNGKFIVKNMNREFKTIEIVIYPDNQLTFISKGKTDYLYKNLPYASFVKFKIETPGDYFRKKYF
jgi:hypothetical protein